jgi:5-methyltetrahydropteroyltriglutamate--homocysteine methyltransferase
MEAIDGFSEYNIDAFLWGNWYGDERVGNLSLERPKGLGVVNKLTRKRHLSAEEFTYLRARTARTPKMTLPSPSLAVSWWSPERSVAAYPTLDSFLADVVDILRAEVAELVRLGATYIQLDAPIYPLLLEPKTRAFYERQGWTLEQWLSRGIEMDNAVIGEFPEVTFGFHL